MGPAAVGAGQQLRHEIEQVLLEGRGERLQAFVRLCDTHRLPGLHRVHRRCDGPGMDATERGRSRREVTRAAQGRPWRHPCDDPRADSDAGTGEGPRAEDVGRSKPDASQEAIARLYEVQDSTGMFFRESSRLVA